jgi:hypothetical protein
MAGAGEIPGGGRPDDAATQNEHFHFFIPFFNSAGSVRTKTRKSEPIDCLVLDFRPPVDGRVRPRQG